MEPIWKYISIRVERFTDTKYNSSTRARPGYRRAHSKYSEQEDTVMFKKLYFIQYPGIMGWEMRRLTQKQVEALRAQGYVVER